MRLSFRAKTAICAVAFLIGPVFAKRASAELHPVSGNIVYVSSASVYVNLGSRDGLRPGQRLTVKQDGEDVAELEVTTLSDRYASLRVVRQTSEVRPGDRVVGSVDIIPEKETVRREEKPPDLSPAELAGLWAQALARKPGSTENRGEKVGNKDASARKTAPSGGMNGATGEGIAVQSVRGRISVSYFRTDGTPQAYNFSQPSITAQLDAERVGGTPLDLSLYVKGSRDIGQNLSGRPGANSRPSVRFYEVSLTSRNPNARYGYGIGRLSLPGLNGVGMFDGASFNWRASDGVRLGLLAGFQPRLTDSAFQGKGSRFGAWISYDRTGNVGFRPNLTATFLRQRAEGGGQSDLIYTQNTVGLPKLYFYQTSEFVLNPAGGGGIRMANAYLSLNCSLARVISFMAGYDAWKNIPEIQGPDSLITEALRQGARLDLRLRLPHGLSVYARSSARLTGGEAIRTTSGTVGVGMGNVAGTGFAPDVHYTFARGALVEARQLDVGLSRPLLRSAYLTGNFQRYRYRVGGSPASRYTARLGLAFWMSRRLYTHIDHEASWGDGFRVQRSFLEMTVRW